MWFVTLVKFRRKPTKADAEAMNKAVSEWSAKGLKVHHALYTLGQFDQVWVYEAPDEKAAMQLGLGNLDLVATQTMAAVARDEVVGWLQ